VLGDVGSDNDLVGRRDCLRVIALDWCSSSSGDQPGIRIGRVDRSRLKRGRVRRERLAASELATVLRLPLSPTPEMLAVSLLGAGLLGLELLAAAAQSCEPAPTVDQLARQLIAARLAKLLILAGVRLGGLTEDPLDLFTNRRVRPG
jgi:hypothetical protein